MKQVRTFKENAAAKIAKAIIQNQVYVSKTLTNWEKQRTIGQKKILFFLFLGIGGCYCTYLLADAIFRNENPVKPNIYIDEIQQIKIPPPHYPPVMSDSLSDSIIEKPF